MGSRCTADSSQSSLDPSQYPPVIQHPLYYDPTASRSDVSSVGRHALTAVAAAAETIPGLACFLLAFFAICAAGRSQTRACVHREHVSVENRIALRNIWRPAKNTNPRGGAPITRRGEMGRRRRGRRSEADPGGSGLPEIQDEERAQRDAPRGDAGELISPPRPAQIIMWRSLAEHPAVFFGSKILYRCALPRAV